MRTPATAQSRRKRPGPIGRRALRRLAQILRHHRHALAIYRQHQDRSGFGIGTGAGLPLRIECLEVLGRRPRQALELPLGDVCSGV